ncbi:AbrB family transcriptional regulator [Zymomonas sp.]|uniref:AbrB family transcriptional regulator n=1 Tax=Zymomonas sp. TaxID=2068624 RepID=UPI0025EE6088|nr:AbrB family transcriptional regulator [Zymomonas sp.]MCA1956524.1 AbrB family transcriptional regulator [Zymomonas sp.]
MVKFLCPPSRWTLKNWPVLWQWTGLILVSVFFTLLWNSLHMPAALLLGPMSAAILFSVMNGHVHLSQKPFSFAQGVIGCMVAHNLSFKILGEIIKDWPIFLGGVFSVIIISNLIGWLLTRLKLFPGTTALWGAAPGAATVMTLMSESYDADIRLVAFMQYFRVICVAVIASFISQIWMASSNSGYQLPSIVWFPPIDWANFAKTLALIIVAIPISRLLHIPNGRLLLPLFTGLILQYLGYIHLTLPPLLLAFSYTMLGWNIGLRFSRAVVSYVAHSFFQVFAAIIVLILLCGCMGALLAHFTHIDPLTAYLATSPGGSDSIAIIAASSPDKIDMAFIMAMQTVRLIAVLLSVPFMTFLSHYHTQKSKA